MNNRYFVVFWKYTVYELYPLLVIILQDLVFFRILILLILKKIFFFIYISNKRHRLIKGLTTYLFINIKKKFKKKSMLFNIISI